MNIWQWIIGASGLMICVVLFVLSFYGLAAIFNHRQPAADNSIKFVLGLLGLVLCMFTALFVKSSIGWPA